MDKLLADLDKNMRDIEYGWVDLDGQKHFDMDNFEEKYRLQAPEAIKTSGVGVCFDQVELERLVFEAHHFKFWSFFIVYYDGAGCPSHSFILFENNEKYY